MEDNQPHTPGLGHITMILTWLNGREAANIGAALADEFAPRAEVAGALPAKKTSASMEQLLRRADPKLIAPLRVMAVLDHEFLRLDRVTMVVDPGGA